MDPFSFSSRESKYLRNYLSACSEKLINCSLPWDLSHDLSQKALQYVYAGGVENCWLRSMGVNLLIVEVEDLFIGNTKEN
jgi:hypothetical protein